MNLYKVSIKPYSSQITPWHSDTVFGSICWSIAQTRGEKVLQDFLSEYDEGKYPLTVSNGFAGDLLPRPLAGNMRQLTTETDKENEFKLAQEAKKSKKINQLYLKEFNTMISNGYTEIAVKDKLTKEAVVVHNQISRYNDTTMEGALYEEYEVFYEDTQISLYMAVEDYWKELIFDMLQIMSLRGFGKAVSRGKGHFKILDIEEFQRFEIPKDPNCYVVLSNYIPKGSESTVGQYKSFVKYGKLGNDFAVSGYPFKKPVLMFVPGSVFWDNNPGYTCGRLVKNISSKYDQVVHSGCALAIPAKIDSPF